MDLFSTISVKGLKIKNRLVMPPLVVLGNCDDEGYVTQKGVAHYEERARNDAGLIVVEATCIDPLGRLMAPQLGVWDDSHVEGLKKIAETCKNHGAGVLLQLHHAGEKAPDDVSLEKVGPSPKEPNVRALTVDEIKEIQNKFLRGALRAKAAGFHGVELHGAHSYLLSQFFSPLCNMREDEYGGDVKGRARIAVQIIKMIREEAGEDFIISVRMGGNEPDLETATAIAKELESAGADLLHVSFGYRPPKKHEANLPEGFPFSAIIYNGLQIKKAVTIPVIVVNGINSAEDARLLAEKYEFDFVAVGRGFLVNSDWVVKLKKGEATKPCLRCRGGCGFLVGRPCPGVAASQ